MLIAISTYIKPLAEVDTHRPAHIEYLKTLFAHNKLLMAGRQNPPTGAVIMTNKLTMQEFQDVLANDPYCQAGVAEYQLIEFAIGMVDESLKKSLE